MFFIAFINIIDPNFETGKMHVRKTTKVMPNDKVNWLNEKSFLIRNLSAIFFS